jgi:hypothetical protein
MSSRASAVPEGTDELRTRAVVDQFYDAMLAADLGVLPTVLRPVRVESTSRWDRRTSNAMLRITWRCARKGRMNVDDLLSREIDVDDIESAMQRSKTAQSLAS